MDTGLDGSLFTLPTPESINSSRLRVCGDDGDHHHSADLFPYKTDGEVPFYRLKSSYCVTDDNTLFLFGGFDDEDDLFDGNIYILDLESGTWETRKHNVFREGHSCTYIGDDTILIIGGEQSNTETDYSEFPEIPVVFYHIKKDIFYEPPYTNYQDYPKGRSRHATCITPDKKKLFISGGVEDYSTASLMSDLYCLDLTNFTWSGPFEFITRFDHVITYHDNKIYSFGGLTRDMNHVNTISWIDLETNLIGSIALKDIPRQTGGDNIYLSSMSYNSGVVMNVIVPLWNPQMNNDEQNAASIAMFDLNKFRWNMVVIGDYPLKGIFWRQSFICQDNLYLLGSASNSENELSEMVKFKLSNIGIPKSNNSRNNNDYVMSFAKMLQDEEFTDFEIFGKDELSSIKVHRAILLARWPHFKRVISSGMVESTTNKMYIPEPISWLRGLVFFLYTNELNPQVTNNIDEYTGLLVLSNLYELPDLKSLCLEKIHHSMNLQNLVFIWKRSILANESLLMSNCAKYMYENWGHIVNSEDFQKLDKDLILKLFEGMDENSKIVTHSQHQCDDATDGIIVDQGTPLTSLNTGFLTRLSSPTQR